MRRYKAKRPIKRRARPYRRYRRTVKFPRRSRQRLSKQIVKGGTYIKDQTFVKLKYDGTYTTTNTSGATSLQVFRGNSIYDPDYTGTGYTAGGYTLYQQFYQKYQVLGARIKVTVYPSNVTGPNAGIAMYSVVPTESQTALSSDYAELQQMPNCRTKTGTWYAGTEKSNTITHYMSGFKAFGVSKMRFNVDEKYFASFGSNPTNQWYWHIYVAPLDRATTTSSTFRAEVTYYVRFFDKVVDIGKR